MNNIYEYMESNNIDKMKMDLDNILRQIGASVVNIEMYTEDKNNLTKAALEIIANLSKAESLTNNPENGNLPSS